MSPTTTAPPADVHNVPERTPEYFLKSPRQERPARIWWYTQRAQMPQYGNCLMCRVIHLAWISYTPDGQPAFTLQDLPEVSSACACPGLTFFRAPPLLADAHVVCFQGDLTQLKLHPPQGFCVVPAPSLPPRSGSGSSGASLPPRGLSGVPGDGYAVPQASLGEPMRYTLSVRWLGAVEAGPKHIVVSPTFAAFVHGGGAADGADRRDSMDATDVSPMDVSPSSNVQAVATATSSPPLGETQAMQTDDDERESFGIPYLLLGTDPPSPPESKPTVQPPTAPTPAPPTQDPRRRPLPRKPTFLARKMASEWVSAITAVLDMRRAPHGTVPDETTAACIQAMLDALGMIEARRDALDCDVILRTRLYHAVEALAGGERGATRLHSSERAANVLKHWRARFPDIDVRAHA
ncbi:hypothetical protein OH77DRAFT_1436224 [Trametes cingulata]|nr:hypothetical protein OH77DRAFT_1436224 [Trametes cingulata]